MTAENFAGMAGYAAVFGRSFLLAGIATVVCILLGYPMAYFLARERGRLQSMATMLIMLPMWMNFLLRTYSWMFLLERNGLVNKILGSLGFFHLLNGLAGALNGAFGLSLPTNVSYVEFLGTSGAVVLGMVYNYLPFMVLPIFSVITKIDNRVIEAAQDLGADSVQVFRRGDLPAVPARRALRRDHGVHPVGVHLRHLPSPGRRQEPAAGRPDRDAVPGLRL